MVVGMHTKTKSISTPCTKKSISISTPKPSQLRCPTQKPCSFRPHLWNQVNFDPHSNIKSISINQDRNRVHFDSDTKTSNFPPPHGKTSKFRSLHWNQSQFRSPPLKSSHRRPPTQQPNHFTSFTGIESSSILHSGIKSICPTHTKNKSISMYPPKPSDCRPVHKHQANFDHPHRNQVQTSSH